MANKIFGYSLIIFGLIVIFYCGINVFLLITKQISAINYFNFDGIFIDASFIQQKISTLQKGIDISMIAPGLDITNKTGSKIEIVTPEILNGMLNFIIHVAVMGFFVNVGSTVATLGTKILKNN